LAAGASVCVHCHWARLFVTAVHSRTETVHELSGTIYRHLNSETWGPYPIFLTWYWIDSTILAIRARSSVVSPGGPTLPYATVLLAAPLGGKKFELKKIRWGGRHRLGAASKAPSRFFSRSFLSPSLRCSWWVKLQTNNARCFRKGLESSRIIQCAE